MLKRMISSHLAQSLCCLITFFSALSFGGKAELSLFTFPVLTRSDLAELLIMFVYFLARFHLAEKLNCLNSLFSFPVLTECDLAEFLVLLLLFFGIFDGK